MARLGSIQAYQDALTALTGACNAQTEVLTKMTGDMLVAQGLLPAPETRSGSSGTIASSLPCCG